MSVQAGSAAAQSKIQAGDFIESINDQSFADAGWNFTFSIDSDADLTLGIIREGQKLTLKLSTQHAPD
jgi:C-terminal processing protease CtpA/Prc